MCCIQKRGAAAAMSDAAPARLVQTSIIAFYAIAFIDTFAVGLCNPVMPNILRSDVIGATMYSAITSVSNGAALFAAVLMGRVSDVHGRKVAIFIAASCSFAGYACYWPGLTSDEPVSILDASVVLPCAGKILTTIGRASLVAPMNALLGDMLGPNAAKRQLSRMMGAFGLGYASGSGVGGYLTHGGMWRPLALAISCAAVKSMCALLLPRVARSQLDKPGDGGSSNGKVPWSVAAAAAVSDRRIRLLLLLQLLASFSFHVYGSTSSLYYREQLGYSASQLGCACLRSICATLVCAQPSMPRSLLLLSPVLPTQICSRSRGGLSLSKPSSCYRGSFATRLAPPPRCSSPSFAPPRGAWGSLPRRGSHPRRRSSPATSSSTLDRG